LNYGLLSDLARVFATDAAHINDPNDSPLVGGLHDERTGTPRLVLIAENIKLRAKRVYQNWYDIK
jgi:hypothetical protein